MMQFIRANQHHNGVQLGEAFDNSLDIYEIGKGLVKCDLLELSRFW